MSADVTVTRRVAAPADVVWHVLTDWPAQNAWMPMTRVRVLGLGDGREVGARLEAWTGLGRAGFLDSMVVTAWDPPCRCEVLHTGRLVRGPGVFSVRALGAHAAEVTWEEHLDLPFGAVGRAGWPLARPAVRFGLGIGLRRFARFVERLPRG
ncbi:SRPBCC family protein [Jiangella endophytica]|uniref:SRPBCC family protein n=1 Tax=Jiangella endophytica TaxID=1623398 RepID=UPI000E35748F|nr:SRPBCC family protein [Jiangella endophytica]